MFEVVLATMESKMRTVENLDRAVEHLMRKMDSIEQKIETKSNNILNRMDNLGMKINSKLAILDKSESSVTNINLRLDHMSSILDAISNNPKEGKTTKRHIKNGEEIKNTPDDVEELFVAQPSNRKTKYVFLIGHSLFLVDIIYFLRGYFSKIYFYFLVCLLQHQLPIYLKRCPLTKSKENDEDLDVYTKSLMPWTM